MSGAIQSRARAGADVVGRDKVTNVYGTVPGPGAIERLLHSLAKQIEDDDTVTGVIEELGRYYVRRSVDGIEGLEAKLRASGRSGFYLDAIEKKEMFAKLLEQYSLYDAAQRIFVHLLAKVETEFTLVVYPDIPSKSLSETNLTIMDRIVHPILNECGHGTFLVNANHVMGMVYWLAEQCFIRWHHDPVDRVAPQ